MADQRADAAFHADDNRVRLVGAALRQIGQVGLSALTLDDVARDAGVSRATLYRAFPGGKDVLLSAVLEEEIRRLFAALDSTLRQADDLETLLVDGIAATGRFLTGHGALHSMIEREPDLLVTHLVRNGLDSLLTITALFTTPHLHRFVTLDAAHDIVEWLVRTIVSYTIHPSERVDLAETESVRRLVRAHLLFGLDPSAALPDPTTTGAPT